MDEKRMLAKMMMLQKLKGDTTQDMHKGLGDGLKAKKMKVVVEAPNPEAMSEGLSKAKQILAAKLGIMPDEMSSLGTMEDMDEMDAESGLEMGDAMMEDGDDYEDAEEDEDLEDLA